MPDEPTLMTRLLLPECEFKGVLCEMTVFTGTWLTDSASGGNGEIDEDGNFRLKKDQKMDDINPTSLNNAKINKVPVGVIVSKYQNSTSLHQTADPSR